VVKGQEYCPRHLKNPNPFKDITPTRIYTRSEKVAALKIQKRWRRFIGRTRFRRQGPIANCMDLANNETEIMTLESVTEIPPIYRFTYRDENSLFWGFDLRTLHAYTGKGVVIKNPYTCEAFPERTNQLLRTRIKFLISRSCPITYMTTDILTTDQVWNNHVLDIFLKIEELGYLVNCDWFHDMTVFKHRAFYKKLYILWYRSLNLTQKQRDAIIPGHRFKESNPFVHTPEEADLVKMAKPLKWWRKKTLSTINLFVSKATEKENRSLGALYCLMAFVSISSHAGEAFPWLVDSVPN